VILLMGWMGCQSPEVLVQGRVMASRSSDQGLGDATIEVRGYDYGLFDTTTADPDGWFEVRAPFQDLIHIVITGEGTVPIVFPGTSGAGKTLVVPQGQLWGMPEAEADGWRDDFAGCPGVDAAGMIVGEAHAALPGVDPMDLEGNPIDINAFAFVLDEAGARTDACVLDDAGDYDPDGELVGATGRFAFFGVEGGPYTLRVGRRVDEFSTVTEWTVFVPEAGAVSLHPALIDL
jgi:hypothetical protein